MRNRLIYIIGWSALLMISTFTEAFKSYDFFCIFYKVHCLKFIDGAGVFLLPLLLAVLLSGIDVIYLYLTRKSNGERIDLFRTFTWTWVFMAGLAISIFTELPACTAIGFYVAWFGLTGMKFAVTENELVLRDISER